MAGLIELFVNVNNVLCIKSKTAHFVYVIMYWFSCSLKSKSINFFLINLSTQIEVPVRVEVLVVVEVPIIVKERNI